MWVSRLTFCCAIPRLINIWLAYLSTINFLSQQLKFMHAHGASRIRHNTSDAAKGLSSFPLLRLIVIPTVHTADPSALAGCLFMRYPTTPQTTVLIPTSLLDVANEPHLKHCVSRNCSTRCTFCQPVFKCVSEEAFLNASCCLSATQRTES